MHGAHKIGSILHFWPIAGYPKLTFSRLSGKAVTAAMICAACWRGSVASSPFHLWAGLDWRIRRSSQGRAVRDLAGPGALNGVVMMLRSELQSSSTSENAA